MGKLTGIDDLATFHCVWDNGRALGLVIGEDSFTVLPPELQTLKLYMPLTGRFYQYNEYGDLDDFEQEIDGHTLQIYEDKITAVMFRNRVPEEAERGIMHWYGEDDTIDAKVKSVVFNVENRSGQLWGVAECRIQGELTPAELDTLKEYITGQASDSWGEGFEQREIQTDEGELYVSLWNHENWEIQTEQERFAPRIADGLPEMCFSTLPSSGALISIRRGEDGYHISDRDAGSKQHNIELADNLNESLGVTPAQRQAMEIGSIYGWLLPGADPKYYDNKPELQMGGLSL